MKKNKAYREKLRNKKAQKRKAKEKKRESIRLKHIENRNEEIAMARFKALKQYQEMLVKQFEEQQNG